ncbi:hypothetical protein CYLTODRAFT_397812 [Cylindrobasidium torrendii FP15055 ss-10]|uniref:Uncharacterized protein n=1 Tax=Cylindrobasidium torrendii FP15055 ss-10 TaxID=1314674 RepID=A0A0D7BA66_9AGAR|nr:hypothetical protein CYLTODRAFT_397812 [Cylindrobasidium torrendii FP15055 ss-10]
MNTWNSWTRPPPPTGAPPTYALAVRRNLRPVVMFCATISGLWALFSAIGEFRSISAANDTNHSSLVMFAIIMGALHLAVTLVEVFGLVSVFTQRIPLVRIYAMMSAFSILLVLGAGIVRVIMHFSKKSDIIAECTTLSTEDDVYFYPYGFWGPVSHTTIDEKDAQNWCSREWSHDSWADIVSLLITLGLAGFFTVVAFSYYRQLLDPNASRMTVPANAPPQHYNPPYNASVPNLPYNQQWAAPPPPQGWAAPQGPPPNWHEDVAANDSKPPGYTGGGFGYGASDSKDDFGAHDPFADANARK